MKKVYYVRVDQHDESKGLMLVNGRAFHEIIQTNKTLPMEERRFFAVQVLDTPGHMCKVLWETSHEISELLHCEDEAVNYNEKNLHKKYDVVPMDEMLEAEYSSDTDGGFSETDTDERLMFDERMKRLDEELSRRKHSDSDKDMVSMYMQGEQRQCVSTLSKKYQTCTKTMRKYRRELDGCLREFYNTEKSTM